MSAGGPTLLVVCCVCMLPQASGDGQACRARLHPWGMSPMLVKAKAAADEAARSTAAPQLAA